MAEYENESISPTLKKVLDEFISVLLADDNIDSLSVDRLDKLLRNGCLPKLEDIDEALFPAVKESNL
jgi:hypothetical protein